MKRNRNLIFLFLVLLNLTICSAQQLRWADYVDYQYNQFDQQKYSAQQALGAPDAFPQGQIHEKAFRLKFSESFGTLILGFREPAPANHLVVIENAHPGRIINISLVDENGKKYVIQESDPEAASTPARALTFKFPLTKYNVKKIEININSVSAPGWHQIDAVGIGRFENRKELERELATFGDFVIERSLVFTSKKERLSGAINTYYTDTKPIISPDGKTLYFARQGYKGNTAGERDLQDIYVSKLTDNEWGQARNIGYPLNDKNGNGVCSVSPDGSTLLLIGKNGPMISSRSSTGWSRPKELVIEDFYHKNRHQDYFMAGNGSALILALDRDDSFGQQDLYVSFKKDENVWGKPVNLGPVINTPANDFSPFLASDNKTLYFASEGREGFGESDIFYAKRLDDTWRNWTEPKNMGKVINSSGWDAYYAVSAAGDYAYFVSNGGGIAGKLVSEYEDIYRIELPNELKPEPVALVTGRVLNAKTNAPIDAEIVFQTAPYGKDKGVAKAAPHDGSFSLVFNSGAKYSFTARADGFISENENLDLTNIDEYTEIRKDLYLIPVEPGQIVKLNNLFFEQSQAALLPESQPELDRLKRILAEHPTMEIELGGHTDSQGSAGVNMELSRRRVEVVKDYLVSQGIEKKRIQTKGYGETRPLYDNSDEETRRLNRRVEVKILR